MADTDGDWLVEILLPLNYNDGSRIDDDLLGSIRKELLDRFGGLTAFTRSPAQGVWTSGSGASRDDIVVLEVMVQGLDRIWWKDWRQRTEAVLRQDEILVRATRVERL
jgi:hypothetical protein